MDEAIRRIEGAMTQNDAAMARIAQAMAPRVTPEALWRSDNLTTVTTSTEGNGMSIDFGATGPTGTTGAPLYENIPEAEIHDNAAEIRRNNPESTVLEWMRSAMMVQDDPINERFIVRIGRLSFPVTYEALADETDRILTVPSTDDSIYKDGAEIMMRAASEEELRKKAKPEEFRRKVFLDVPKT